MSENHLIPLFWQHGESEEVLREEIARMDEAGIHSFIAEARPHPDYLGPGWWRDMEILVDEAKRRGMKMWIFDDGLYPSGCANNLIAERFPQYTKRYLDCRYIDAIGPLRGSSFWAGGFVEDGEDLLAVVCGRRSDQMDQIDPISLQVLTQGVRDDILWWDVPEGDWRIFLLVKTPRGGEDYTKRYLDPLSREATARYLELIHEQHYQHLGAEFGKTIAGFFTDEPRFGSSASYYALPGRTDIVLPWTDGLLDDLAAKAGGLENAVRLLPSLWYGAPPASPDFRYHYMDVVSKRFAENFIGQMGRWCRDRGVKLIGHFVEENGSHARIGYGPGHFFRATEQLDMAGMDVVCNLYPGRREGTFLTPLNNYDTVFNHWGLAKMTSSAAILDPKKKGLTFCETFGAYGWSEGLKTMKWITDVLCVRGINTLTPHAFSPKECPDPDCPPHFYARGKNPQWAGFPTWAGYANRLCEMLSGGLPKLAVGVLYHAEAEWGGDYQPFELPVKLLSKRQIDSLILPADDLIAGKGKVESGVLTVQDVALQAIVIPYAQYLPPAIAEVLNDFAEQGLPVFFLNGYPDRCYAESEPFRAGNIGCIQTDELVEKMESILTGTVHLSPPSEFLSIYHYQKEGGDFFFCVNEDVNHPVSTTLALPVSHPVALYDILQNRLYSVPQQQGSDSIRLSLTLEPYESIMIVPGDGAAHPTRQEPGDFPREQPIDGMWRLSLLPHDGEIFGPEEDVDTLGDITAPGRLPTFSGTARYVTDFDWQGDGDALLELGEVYELAWIALNGDALETLICPPYRVHIPADKLREGANQLEILVTNTLAKANVGNRFDRFWPQEPSGLLGPVVLRHRENTVKG